MQKWHEVSERFSELPKSEFDKILEIAEENKNIISLGPGEPDFKPDKRILDFTRKLLSKNYTHYSPSAGAEEVREAIAKKLKRENKIECGPENVIVTAGSTEAILLALMSAIDPEEGVLVPDPGFLDYAPIVETLTGDVENYPLTQENNLQPTHENLEKTVKENSRVLLINTPGNPTGKVFSKKVLEEIADVAVEHDLLIFSDEAYEKFVYDGTKHISIGSLNGLENRVVTLHTFSKTYAMTGFRIGYACGPKKLISAMDRLHLYTSVSAATPFQFAAKYALESKQTYVKKMINEFGRRRKLLLKRMEEINGFSFVKPEGAFYTFPNISSFGMSSVKFSHMLLQKAKVLVVPGTEFGKNGEGFIRLSYATDYKKIETAMDRIEKVLKAL